ncbi:MAG: alpha-L-fucosidase [Bacteroidales bacterium]|nr:alpha-L-fucosidase [Bacteroidales bacterium]
MKKCFFSTFLCLVCMMAFAQTDDQRPETDPIITNRISQWQDLKFGFMMHWGIYAQWEVVESWSICNEPWINRNGADYYQYKTDYQNLNKTFNPQHFDPTKWAEAAKGAGMKYVVFTTKHHDGFCMFGTKETSYSTVDPSCPFSNNPKADITGEVVKAFREKGFWTGLYFSKPDWHCDDYWAHEWATPDRNVNYDPTAMPERFEKYKQFTHRQIRELTHNYGDIDILWLDGGWVRPEWSVNDETRPWLGCQGYIQDIDMPTVAKIARENNPDLIIVDRSVGGKYENYQTPEQQVPDSLLPYPWETCMSMGNSWSYVSTDTYKSTNKLIHLLCDIVAKGGNFLLNVGPDADGNLPDTALLRMKEIGEWMQVNGESIYGTRPIYPFTYGKFRFTQKGDKVYGIFLLDEQESPVPETYWFDGKGMNLKTGRIKVLGCNKKASLCREADGRYRIDFPNHFEMPHAVVFEMKTKK